MINENNNQNLESSEQDKEHLAWDNWVESKREVACDNNGNKIIEKATFEFKPRSLWWIRNKDIIDIVLRFIGLIAIAVPILLFYLQQQNEKEKQKVLLQINLFSETTSKLHFLLLQDSVSDEEVTNLYYNNYQKICLISNDSIKLLLNEIIFNLYNYRSYSKYRKESETLKHKIGDYYVSETKMRRTQIDSTLKNFQSENSSIFSSLLNSFEKTKERFPALIGKLKGKDSITNTAIFLKELINEVNQNSRYLNSFTNCLTTSFKPIISNNTSDKNLYKPISFANCGTYLDLDDLQSLTEKYKKIISDSVDKLDIKFAEANREFFD